MNDTIFNITFAHEVYLMMYTNPFNLDVNFFGRHTTENNEVFPQMALRIEKYNFHHNIPNSAVALPENEVVEWLKMKLNTAPNSNIELHGTRLALANRRGRGKHILCNPKSVNRFVTPQEFTVHFNNYMPLDKVIVFYKGVSLIDSPGYYNGNAVIHQPNLQDYAIFVNI